jgi:cell division transport system ATP-binding protein
MTILTEISNSGRAVIMATHNYNMLKKFPARTMKCEKGKLEETKEGEEIDFASLMQ